ncbi:Morn repeat domain containing protein, variant 2 [Balamuthia mandrillaris]
MAAGDPLHGGADEATAMIICPSDHPPTTPTLQPHSFSAVALPSGPSYDLMSFVPPSLPQQQQRRRRRRQREEQRDDVEEEREEEGEEEGEGEEREDGLALFPDELVQHIFSFLSGAELWNAVRRVCKHWMGLVDDDQLWLSLLRRAELQRLKREVEEEERKAASSLSSSSLSSAADESRAEEATPLSERQKEKEKSEEAQVSASMERSDNEVEDEQEVEALFSSLGGNSFFPSDEECYGEFLDLRKPPGKSWKWVYLSKCVPMTHIAEPLEGLEEEDTAFREDEGIATTETGTTITTLEEEAEEEEEEGEGDANVSLEEAQQEVNRLISVLEAALLSRSGSVEQAHQTQHHSSSLFSSSSTLPTMLQQMHQNLLRTSSLLEEEKRKRREEGERRNEEKSSQIVIGRYECDSWIYEGEWLNGRPHGWGRKYWKTTNGRVSDGYATDEEAEEEGSLGEAEEDDFEEEDEQLAHEGRAITRTSRMEEEHEETAEETKPSAYLRTRHNTSVSMTLEGPASLTATTTINNPSTAVTSTQGKTWKQILLRRRQIAKKKTQLQSYYEGEWKNGREHGQGLRVFPDKEEHYYKGEWKNGMRDGFGVYHWPNKTSYEGQFRDGYREGYGIYTWSPTAKYEGHWLRGIEHGKGVRTWVDGDRYEGDWVGLSFLPFSRSFLILLILLLLKT